MQATTVKHKVAMTSPGRAECSCGARWRQPEWDAHADSLGVWAKGHRDLPASPPDWRDRAEELERLNQRFLTEASMAQAENERLRRRSVEEARAAEDALCHMMLELADVRLVMEENRQRREHLEAQLREAEALIAQLSAADSPAQVLDAMLDASQDPNDERPS